MAGKRKSAGPDGAAEAAGDMTPVTDETARRLAAALERIASIVEHGYGDGITPAQAGEEDEFCDEAPNPCETCDHRFHLVKAKRVGTCVRCGDSWPVWGDY